MKQIFENTRLKRIILFLLISFLPIITGCMSIDIKQEIGSDSIATTQIIYEVQEQYIDSSLPQSQQITNQAQNICENVELTSLKDIEITSCEEISNFKYQLDVKSNLSEDFFESDSSIFSTTYTYDISYIFHLLDKLNSTELSFSREDLPTMSAFEANIDYEVFMTGGQIENYEVGKIQNPSTLHLNLSDLYTASETKVQFKKTNYISVVLLVLIVIIFITGLFYLSNKYNLVKYLKTIKNLKPISKQETSARDYILKFKHYHGKEEIFNELVKGGVGKDKAEEYLKKYFK